MTAKATFKRILFPTDGSDLSKQAFDYAVEMADTFDAELHVLYVIELFNYDPSSPDWTFPPHEAMKEVENHAFRMMEGVTRSGGHDIRIKKVIKKGSAYGEIIGYADSNDIDLIVMATHGRSGLAHVLIGSTAEKVVRHAPCPVLTLKPVEENE